MTLDIVDRIEMDLLKGELQLPVMPSIAAKINATADDPEQGINDLAKLIHSDVALTAHVIQTSNSAFYRGNVQNKTLIQSLNRLGMEGTRILAMGYCVKAMYASSNGKKPHPMLQRQWQSDWCVRTNTALSHTSAHRTL